MSPDSVIFIISAVVAVFGATMIISQRNPVASVLYLILSLLAQAVCYVQLGALFLGAILVIVYAGAIMVLFLFVIMLLNLRGSEDLGAGSAPLNQATKFTISILLVVELVFAIKEVFLPGMATGIVSVPVDDFGSIKSVAMLMFTKYLYPFELTGVLLLIAVVGAVVIAKRESSDDDESDDLPPIHITSDVPPEPLQKSVK
ncbi:MAG: NADH-quinone oxidoreductase subunit J [candidate division Zixibacteria bacterium]|nr:NADH-quinone oxidoreductase subunit J [candidate division Zixibacteria bacterium]